MNNGDPKSLDRRLLEVRLAESSPEELRQKFLEQKQLFLESDREAFMHHPTVANRFGDKILDPATDREMYEATMTLTYFNGLDPSQAHNPVFPGYQGGEGNDMEFSHLNKDSMGGLTCSYMFKHSIRDHASDLREDLQSDDHAIPTFTDREIPEHWQRSTSSNDRISDSRLNDSIQDVRDKLDNGSINPHQTGMVYDNGMVDYLKTYKTLHRFGATDAQTSEMARFCEGRLLAVHRDSAEFYNVDQDLTLSEIQEHFGYSDQQMAAFEAQVRAGVALSGATNTVRDEIGFFGAVGLAKKDVSSHLREPTAEGLRELTDNDLSPEQAAQVADDISRFHQAINDPNYQASRYSLPVTQFQMTNPELVADQNRDQLPHVEPEAEPSAQNLDATQAAEAATEPGPVADPAPPPSAPAAPGPS